MNKTYQITLTEPEYQHLLKLADEGVQAAMLATLTVEPLETRNEHRGNRSVRERIQAAPTGLCHA